MKLQNSSKSSQLMSSQSFRHFPNFDVIRFSADIGSNDTSLKKMSFSKSTTKILRPKVNHISRYTKPLIITTKNNIKRIKNFDDYMSIAYGPRVKIVFKNQSRFNEFQNLIKYKNFKYKKAFSVSDHTKIRRDSSKNESPDMEANILLPKVDYKGSEILRSMNPSSAMAKSCQTTRLKNIIPKYTQIKLNKQLIDSRLIPVDKGWKKKITPLEYVKYLKTFKQGKNGNFKFSL